MYIIGIDLDTTLVGSNILIEDTSKKLGYNYTLKDITDWHFDCFPEDLRNELFKRFTMKEYMCNKKYMPPIEGANRKLREWKKQGHKLILITARARQIRFETRKMINKYFPKFNKIIFVNMGKPKKNIFKREYLTHWIDDNADDCKAAVDMNIETYLISNNYTHYNWNMRKYKNIKTVKSINDIKLKEKYGIK